MAAWYTFLHLLLKHSMDVLVVGAGKLINAILSLDSIPENCNILPWELFKAKESTDKAMPGLQMGVADTLPGSASFFKYAASKGITVFYVTNREENEREGTLKNLRKFNFPNADAGHLLLKQHTSGTEARRQQVMKDYEVVLLLGDNLSDFTNLFDKQPEDQRMSAANQQQSNFGKNFIVLPNVSYGDWESSLYKFNNNLSPAEKERIIKASLKGE